MKDPHGTVSLAIVPEDDVVTAYLITFLLNNLKKTLENDITLDTGDYWGQRINLMNPVHFVTQKNTTITNYGKINSLQKSIMFNLNNIFINTHT